jgi:hypothetical protein
VATAGGIVVRTANDRICLAMTFQLYVYRVTGTLSEESDLRRWQDGIIGE